MSATGLDVFDKTLHTTNIWLDEVMAELGADRKRAYRALGAVLQTLRDRLPVDDCAHLSAQLPILVRGIYFHDWLPSLQPSPERTRDDFLAIIADRLADAGPIDPAEAASAVFQVLNQHVTLGEVAKVRAALPEPIRQLWPPPVEVTGNLSRAAEALKGAEHAAPPWPARATPE